MAVARKPNLGMIFGQPAPAAAWKAVPTWYVVAQQDRAPSPELQRFYASRLNARTTEIPSSHLPFISHPRARSRT